jgi:hypothetical protein
MEDNIFVNRAWEKWLSGLRELYNIHILDLFYWEHWGGNFCAMTQAEWDIVQEVFTPYNCRNLLMKMLSVDEKYRDHDLPIFYRELSNKLWPEVLREPVNPKPQISNNKPIRSFMRYLLKKTHLYDKIKRIVNLLS